MQPATPKLGMVVRVLDILPGAKTTAYGLVAVGRRYPGEEPHLVRGTPLSATQQLRMPTGLSTRDENAILLFNTPPVFVNIILLYIHHTYDTAAVFNTSTPKQAGTAPKAAIAPSEPQATTSQTLC